MAPVLPRLILPGDDPSPLCSAEGGLVPVDKPAGWTSRQVVNAIQDDACERRVKAGHGGTLDPFATGLLIIGTGKHTRFLAQISSADKVYVGTALLGIQTDTGDPEGYPIQTCSVTLTPDLKEKVMLITEDLTGWIEQRPPRYSAIRIRGKRAYELARMGVQNISLSVRTVRVYRFDVWNFRVYHWEKVPEISCVALDFRIHCSKGTYIRSLVEELGNRAGFPAFTLRLRRTRIGALDVEKAWDLRTLLQLLKNHGCSDSERE